MIDDFQVPGEYLGAFRRLVRKMPIEFQTDTGFLQTLIMYLKLGGEKLAVQRIEVEKSEFRRTVTLVKRQATEESEAVQPSNEDQDQDGATADADSQEDALDRTDDIEDIDPDTIAS